ncbi:GNAT family N-acetyltransferase [Paenibacillus sp. HJL G12]|uniref:GNAT family N-acetyltransferase n=1 Tax=Paenibacillus dendrobii TaxID=2691084 RepID=A0A7X3IHC6_9BACL|nr:GNAT family protein [Paenibacillus dendrobii]MWV42540.1 GNAT family N-acetyltransferase [Paenibacillus dendrobii]
MDVSKLFSESPIFETDRLYLRRLSLEDAGDYFNFASNPQVTIYTIWETHQSINDSTHFIKYILKKYESREAYHWGIVDKTSNRIIGRTGFISWDVAHQRAEIGFALSCDFWNKGIITEANNQIIQYGFMSLNLNRIEGRCNFDNIGSGRAMEKVGMIEEGILRDQLKIKGKFVDQKMYSILKRDSIS